MSERTDRMIESLVPWERDDPNVQGVMVASGEELDRVEDLMTTVRDQAWPNRADDSYGLLSVHERTMQLTVAPQGVSVAERQTIIETTFGRRRDGRKGTWAARLSDLVGAGQWIVHQATPGPHQILVILSVSPETGLAAQVQDVIQRFTPVVEEVTVAYDGFFLGFGELGETDL